MFIVMSDLDPIPPTSSPTSSSQDTPPLESDDEIMGHMNMTEESEDDDDDYYYDDGVKEPRDMGMLELLKRMEGDDVIHVNDNSQGVQSQNQSVTDGDLVVMEVQLLHRFLIHQTTLKYGYILIQSLGHLG